MLGARGARHQATLRVLLEADASKQPVDRSGATPLQSAQSCGYAAIVLALTEAGVR